MGEQLAKLLLGTALYVAIIWVGRRRPRAAGMMLTFPALNGITMLMAAPEELSGVTNTMLIMPAFNGLVCSAFLALSERVQRTAIDVRKTTLLTWLFFVLGWIVIALALLRFGLSISPAYHLMYLAAATVIGGAMTTVFPIEKTKPTDAAAAAFEPLFHLLVRNRIRIALFMLGLAAVLVCAKLKYSPAVLGVLGALPLVPFFGLYTVSADREVSPEARRSDLAAMANGVWLGPAIAIGFILAYGALLQSLATLTIGDIAYLSSGVASLIVCWMLCLAAIWGAEKLLSRI